MSKEEIIKEIIKRFKLDSASIRNMEAYEYDLIYDSFYKIPPEIIDAAINSFINKDFKLKVIRTSFY